MFEIQFIYEEISPAGIAAMAEKRSVAVILPTTAYLLRLKAPPVRDLIDQGVPVALGSDFNPNAHCLAMVSLLLLMKEGKINTFMLSATGHELGVYPVSHDATRSFSGRYYQFGCRSRKTENSRIFRKRKMCRFFNS